MKMLLLLERETMSEWKKDFIKKAGDFLFISLIIS
jgi:hypothetical protein